MTTENYVQATSLPHALEVRTKNPTWSVICGGTDIMVGALERPTPPGILSLWNVDGLVGVTQENDTLRIGAATPYAQLLEDPAVQNHCPMLVSCMREIGAAQIQNRGTPGGNIATSSPVGDTLPIWLATHATVELASLNGRRHVPYREFCTGYRQTALGPEELITAIVIPLPTPAVQFWRKVGTRRAQAISKVMLAASARRNNGALKDVVLALGAVADRPVRVPAAEALLEGQAPSLALAQKVGDAVREAVTPIDDVRSSAAYRRFVAGNLVTRFVQELAHTRG